MAEPDYFKITCVDDGSPVISSIRPQLVFTQATQGAPTPKIYWRYQGETEWQSLSLGIARNIVKDETIEFKGDPTNTTFASDYLADNCVYLKFSPPATATSRSKFKVSGDITTLLDGIGGIKDLTGRDYCFANFGYITVQSFMEIDCSELVLPSTTLAQGCYYNMFGRYSFALKSAPELPATSLANSCYNSMFSGCSSLDYVKASVKWDQLVSGKSDNWLSGVSATGTFESTDPDFNPQISRSATTVPSGWTLDIAEPPESDFWLNGQLVSELYLNSKKVASLYINGKKVAFGSSEPPGPDPDPKLTNFRITNIGNATDNPDDSWRVQTYLPSGCDMKVYHSDSGETTTLTAGQTTTMTLPYGEYLEFEGDNPNGLYPSVDYCFIKCPEGGAYEASGQLSSLAKLDIKEAGYSFYGLFTNNLGLVNADNLVLPGGYDGCSETYYGMFSGCSSLEKGPEGIPYFGGTNQYKNMFIGCSSLMSIGVNWTEWPPSNNTKTWLANASTDGTFKCPTALEIPSRDENGVLSGWTIVRT